MRGDKVAGWWQWWTGRVVQWCGSGLVGWWYGRGLKWMRWMRWGIAVSGWY